MGVGKRQSAKRKGKKSRRKASKEITDDKVREVFDKVDKNKSGKIDSRELGEAMSNGGWEPFNEGTIALMIGMFDKNGDGVVSFSEFKSLWKYVHDWQACFKRSDKDGSGAIGKAEMLAALSSFGYRLSPRFVAFLIARFDRTESSQLFFDDFVEACVLLETVTATFKARDAGRRGVVSYVYEDFLTDALDLIFRLQAGVPGGGDDERPPTPN